MDELGAALVPKSPPDLVDHLTLANVYCIKLSGEREAAEQAESFEVHIEPAYRVESGRIDYLFDARCRAISAKDTQVGIIEVSYVATFDVDETVATERLESDLLEWIGGNLALFAAYPYLREAVQAVGDRLGVPNMTMDILRRGEALPEGLSIGSGPERSEPAPEG